MEIEKVDVIQALAGYFTIIDLGDELILDDPVIAWRIETGKKLNSDEYFSICTAITVDGDQVSNCIGVQNPDNTVTTFGDSRYKSLEELSLQIYPSKGDDE